MHNAAWGPAGGKEGKYLNGKLITDCPEAAELLLEKGAVTVDFQDFDGNSPFIIAAASQGVESMRVLYRYGADVNKQNIKGETSIFFACRFGHLDSLKVLIEELKASLNVTNNDGLSNLACCLMNDNWEIFDILKEKEFFLKKLDDYQRDFSYLILNKTEKLLLFDALKRLLDFLKEKNLHLKFKEEYIPLVTSFEKKETFGLIFQYFKEQITTNQKEQIFYELIEKLKLSFLIIFEENDKEFFSLFNPNPEFIIRIIKNKKISIDFMENILFETHFDLLKVPNLIHFTIDTHNVPLLITLRNVFSLENKNKIANKFIQNLLSQTKEVKDRKIIEFLLKIDSKTQMNCFEYAKFKKTHDLEKILKDFANVFLKNSDLPIENYCIPYKILEESNKDIDYFHSKKQFLEETNQKITENKNFSSQYFHKTEEENLYFEKILKSPFNFAKKTTFLYIKTEEDLLKMSQEIKKFSVFGIDLEFHCSCPNELFSTDYNEGQISENIVPLTKISGFVCTMQLSTIERDYIIDALYLRDQIGYYLKDFFEDFTKIKLFHGCDYDLQWLKVDLDIEVVNLFDTSKAFMIANNDKKSISLAKLTKHYLNLEMDKSFQKSFWGLRPLPKGMLDYARLDSDVLLGLFSCMLQELEEKSMLGSMAMTCNRMCWEKVEKIKLKKTNMIILKDLKK